LIRIIFIYKNKKLFKLINNSFQILRTNPSLTSNLRIVVNSNYNLYLESIPISKELSEYRYKHYSMNKESYYELMIGKFFKDTPSDIIFKVHYDNDNNIVQKDYSLQYDVTYFSGAMNVQDQWYEEEFQYFAPLYFYKKMPNSFIILRVDDPCVYETKNNSYDISSLNSNNFRTEIIDKWKCVKLFDMSFKSDLGYWLYNNFTNNERFPKNAFELDAKKFSFSRWYGLDVNEGIYTSKSNFIDDFVYYEQPHFKMEQFLTDAYKNNNILYPNILNLSFLFDDTPATQDDLKKYSINRYYGFYVDELNWIMDFTTIQLHDLKPNLQINNNVFVDENNNTLSIEPFLDVNNWVEPYYIYAKGTLHNVKKTTINNIDYYKIISNEIININDVNNMGIIEINNISGVNYLQSNNLDFRIDSNYDESGNEQDLYGDLYVMNIDNKYHILKSKRIENNIIKFLYSGNTNQINNNFIISGVSIYDSNNNLILNNINGLPINSIFIESNNDIHNIQLLNDNFWITTNSGISLYDLNNNLILYTIGNSKYDFIVNTGSTINTIILKTNSDVYITGSTNQINDADETNNYFIIKTNNNISEYDFKNNFINNFTGNTNQIFISGNTNQINDLVVTNDNFIIATNNGISVYDLKNNFLLNTLNGLAVNSLFIEGNNLYCGTNLSGVTKHKLDNISYIFDTINEDNSNIISNDILKVYVYNGKVGLICSYFINYVWYERYGSKSGYTYTGLIYLTDLCFDDNNLYIISGKNSFRKYFNFDDLIYIDYNSYDSNYTKNNPYGTYSTYGTYGGYGYGTYSDNYLYKLNLYNDEIFYTYEFNDVITKFDFYNTNFYKNDQILYSGDTGFRDFIINNNFIYSFIRVSNINYFVIFNVLDSSIVKYKLNNHINIPINLSIKDNITLISYDDNSYEVYNIYDKSYSFQYYFNTDYAINFNSKNLEYWIGGKNSEYYINKNIDNNNPLICSLYKVRFLDIKDFDFDRVDTRFADFDYEEDIYVHTDEQKLYTVEYRDNSNPKKFKLVPKGKSGQYNTMIVSSEYISTDELFEIVTNNDLTPLWRKVQNVCKWGYLNSNSNSDYEYKYNNSNKVGFTFNRTTNVFSIIPNIYEKNLDYMYRIGEFHNNGIIKNYKNQTTNIETSLMNEDSKLFNLDLYVNSDFDYFEYFFKNKQVVTENGQNYIKQINKFSTFVGGDNINTYKTLFKGINYELFAVDDISYSNFYDENNNIVNSIDRIINDNSIDFSDYKFSVIFNPAYNYIYNGGYESEKYYGNVINYYSERYLFVLDSGNTGFFDSFINTNIINSQNYTDNGYLYYYDDLTYLNIIISGVNDFNLNKDELYLKIDNLTSVTNTTTHENLYVLDIKENYVFIITGTTYTGYYDKNQNQLNTFYLTSASTTTFLSTDVNYIYNFTNSGSNAYTYLNYYKGTLNVGLYNAGSTGNCYSNLFYIKNNDNYYLTIDMSDNNLKSITTWENFYSSNIFINLPEGGTTATIVTGQTSVSSGITPQFFISRVIPSLGTNNSYRSNVGARIVYSFKKNVIYTIKISFLDGGYLREGTYIYLNKNNYYDYTLLQNFSNKITAETGYTFILNNDYESLQLRFYFSTIYNSSDQSDTISNMMVDIYVETYEIPVFKLYNVNTNLSQEISIDSYTGKTNLNITGDNMNSGYNYLTVSNTSYNNSVINISLNKYIVNNDYYLSLKNWEQSDFNLNYQNWISDNLLFKRGNSKYINGSIYDINNIIDNSKNQIHILLNKKFENVLIIVNHKFDFNTQYIDINNIYYFKEKYGYYYGKTIDDVLFITYSGYTNYNSNIFTASNFITAINNVNIKSEFDDYIKYHFINDVVDSNNNRYYSVVINDNMDSNTANTIKNLSNWNKVFSPYMLMVVSPEILTIYKNSYNTVPVKGPVYNIYDKYRPTGFLYDNSFDVKEPIARSINRTYSKQTKIIVEYGTNQKYYDINIYRYNGSYIPIFKDIELFNNSYYYVLTGYTNNIFYKNYFYLKSNYKFNEKLQNFATISEIIYSKVNPYQNILKLPNNNKDKSIYPMIDEFGYSYKSLFIFKSTWDREFYITTYGTQENNL
jgi:hypothetical protein